MNKIVLFTFVTFLLGCSSMLEVKSQVDHFRRITSNYKVGSWDINNRYGWSFSKDSVFYEYYYDEYGSKRKEYYSDVVYPEPMKFKIVGDTLILKDFDELKFIIVNVNKKLLILKEISQKRIQFGKDSIVVFKKSKKEYSY